MFVSLVEASMRHIRRVFLENAPRPISHSKRVRQLVASLDGGFCRNPERHQIEKESLSELLPLDAVDTGQDLPF
jgi:hypothetical protein